MGAIRRSARRGLVRELAGALAAGKEAFLAFIERHSIPEPNTGCWLWTEGAGKEGYAWIVDPRRPIQRSAMPRVGVYRLVCEVLHRPMEPKEHARHLCHNPGCVNPEHLTPGSALDNLMDSVRAGRWTPQRGAENGRAKITDNDVRMLRAEFQPYTQGQTDIWSRRLGISETSVRNIAAGRTWPHVKQEPV